MEKKMIWLWLLAAAVLTLAACSAGGENPSPDHPDKDVLIYASFQPLGVNKEVQLAIEQFNRVHYGKVHIEIRDYWGDDWETAARGRERLMTELLTDQIPDILDLGYSNGSVAMLPYRRLVQKGYLEDLWPFIENDPDLGRDSLLEPPLRAAEIDGGLYTVFDSVLISTLVGAESAVGDRTSWTMADLRTAYAAMPEDSTVVEYSTPRKQVAEHLLGMSIDRYIDWESGECSFDCGSFRTDLEFLGELPEEVVWPSDEELNRELSDRLREGRQLLAQTFLRSPHDMQKWDGLFGERTAFVGYPVEDGSVGSAFFPSFVRLSMSSTCKNKEAAWEIIRQLLLPRYADQQAVADAYNIHNIPVNRADYEMIKCAYMKKDFLNREYGFYRGFQSVSFHEVTEGEIRRFEGLLNSVERIELSDSELLEIVMDAAGPYFAGDKTLDETVELIQRRAQLYVNENR